MANNYLIKVQALKQKGLVHQDADTKLLKRCIIICQDKMIQPATGSILYRALLTRVEDNDWTANYRTLMNDYIVPALVALVDYKASVYLSRQLRNKGTGKSTDEDFAILDQEELSLAKNELRADAEFYVERLVGYLKDDNGTLFSEYTEGITRTNHDIKKDRGGYSNNFYTG